MTESTPNSPGRVALFGGTFDPVHHGHLLLAQDALEQLQLDLLLFIPARVNPHKLQSTQGASPEQRVEMLRLATRGVDRLQVDPSEILRAGPSFTVDTVESLQTRWPEAQFFWLLGEDNLEKLHTWHRIHDLRSLVRFVCFGRLAKPPPFSASYEFPRLERRIDISATEIRQRIARGLSIRYLVPESVRAFIENHALYQPQTPSQSSSRTGSTSA